MIDPVILINAILAAMVVIFGLSSRNFATALVAGLFIGLIHAGLIALVAAQSGSTAIAELPCLKDAIDFAMKYKDGVDLAMKYGTMTLAQLRFATYLVAIALATLIIMVVAYLVRWIIVSLVGLMTPKRTATQE